MLPGWRPLRVCRALVCRGFLPVVFVLVPWLAAAANAVPSATVEADSVRTCRTPAAALAIAIVPGAIVHGAGHLYAGDVRTARWLALSEAAGYAAMFTSHARGADRGDDTHGGAIVYGVGAGLFFGSWLYDILAAPTAVRARCAPATAALARWQVGALAQSGEGWTLGVACRF